VLHWQKKESKIEAIDISFTIHRQGLFFNFKLSPVQKKGGYLKMIPQQDNVILSILMFNKYKPPRLYLKAKQNRQCISSPLFIQKW